MSYNGSGTFLINSAGQPVVANTVISATTFNALTADLANGLTTCITKDGQTTPTANIPMGGFKITNLANGTAATDAATVAQIQSNGAALVTVTGTDTLTGTLTPALTTYVTGAVYYFIAPATNTGAVTLNIDTLGAKNVTRDGTTALVAGDIVSGEMVAVVYDGTRFQLISPVNSFTNLNVSGTLTVAGAATLNGNLQVGNAGSDTVNFQASGWTLTNNVSVIGTWADIGTITTADINGGTIDGTIIGGGTAAAGTFTTATATTGNITTVNATTVDSTNLEVTNLKAKDGTAAGSIADSTGVVTLNSVVATTADINGGTIDATTIGGSSPAVGNFTTVSAASAVFTTATITTVNTTTLDLTNLEVTNIKAKDGTASMVIDDATGKVNATTVSAASMNAGVAAVTSLTATGASVASANVGTAIITNGTVTALTATGASIASMNAGVALLTTATVTNFTASGASITSANIGNLQFTAASIASINAGVAVVTNLTATSASIASANVGTAVITTGTVTNLTSTSASIASMNAGVALLTTATVTNLTATGASVASANLGTAVVTGLTVTGASIASVNAGVAVLSGNLTLNGGTANGVLYLNGSKVATSGSALTFDGTSFVGPNFRSNSFVEIRSDTANLYWENAANTRYYSMALSGTSTSPTLLTTYFDGTSVLNRLALDSSGNLSLTSGNLSIASGSVFYLSGSGGNAYLQESGGTLFLGAGGAGRVQVTSDGNLGLGVTPSAWSSPDFRGLQVGSGIALYGRGSGDADRGGLSANAFNDGAWKYIATGNATNYVQSDGSHAWYTAASGTAGNTISFTQAMTLTAASELYIDSGTSGGRLTFTPTGSNNTIDSTTTGFAAFSTIRTRASNHQWLIGASTQAMTLDASGRLGVGVTSPDSMVEVNSSTAAYARFKVNYNGSALTYLGSFSGIVGSGNATDTMLASTGVLAFGAGGTTERARITSGGKFLVGQTTININNNNIAEFEGSCGLGLKSTGGSAFSGLQVWNNAASGDNLFVEFLTDTAGTVRGTIDYNRAGGQVRYNTTSDYRAKEVYGPVDDSGEQIDALKVYRGKMLGATQERPMMIAHEAQEVVPYAVGGEKDAVDEDGKPKYQTMDHQILVPLLIAELQSLRKRVAELEAK